MMEGEVGGARASELGTWGLLPPGLIVAWLLLASLASDVSGDRLFCVGIRLAGLPSVISGSDKAHFL